MNVAFVTGRDFTPTPEMFPVFIRWCYENSRKLVCRRIRFLVYFPLDGASSVIIFICREKGNLGEGRENINVRTTKHI